MCSSCTRRGMHREVLMMSQLAVLELMASRVLLIFSTSLQPRRLMRPFAASSTPPVPAFPWRRTCPPPSPCCCCSPAGSEPQALARTQTVHGGSEAHHTECVPGVMLCWEAPCVSLSPLSSPSPWLPATPAGPEWLRALPSPGSAWWYSCSRLADWGPLSLLDCPATLALISGTSDSTMLESTLSREESCDSNWLMAWNYMCIKPQSNYVQLLNHLIIQKIV